MMEQKIETKGDIKLYRCNPERNKKCDKRFCMHNKNAIEKLCDATTKKENALLIGETAKEKEYTPPVKKNRVLI